MGSAAATIDRRTLSQKYLLGGNLPIPL